MKAKLMSLLSSLASGFSNAANRREAQIIMAVVALLGTYAAQHFGGNWFHSMWFGYVRPSLVGNGPEDIVMTGLIALAIPSVRKWLKAHIHMPNKVLMAKIDHIITNHPDIPNEVPGLPAQHQPVVPPAKPDVPS